MAEMGEMEMPLPDNTLPMMTGFGQFGPMEMGGMFSVVKVRDGLAAGDYKDPGPYKNPAGTVAYEFAGNAGDAPQAPASRSSRAPAAEFNVIKPGSRPSTGHDH
jgi:manganese oxidase